MVRNHGGLGGVGFALSMGALRILSLRDAKRSRQAVRLGLSAWGRLSAWGPSAGARRGWPIWPRVALICPGLVASLNHEQSAFPKAQP